MRLPAFCDNPKCNHIFYSGIEINNSTNATFSSNKAGPCPKCGDMGHIPDGVFNFLNNTIEIISAPNKTFDDLSKLGIIIKEAREKQWSREEIIKRIEEETPFFLSIKNLLPATRNELYGFLSLILIVIGMTKTEPQNLTVNNVTINQVVEQVYKSEPKQTKSAGGIVINEKGEIFLIVSQHGTSWSLPKGHIEEGEDIMTAARREIYEETGIKDLEFIKELGSYQRYKIDKNGKEDFSEFKTIFMSLFRTKEKFIKPIDPENPEARWVEKDQIAELLTHPKDKEFFLSIKDKI